MISTSKVIYPSSHHQRLHRRLEPEESVNYTVHQTRKKIQMFLLSWNGNFRCSSNICLFHIFYLLIFTVDGMSNSKVLRKYWALSRIFEEFMILWKIYWNIEQNDAWFWQNVTQFGWFGNFSSVSRIPRIPAFCNSAVQHRTMSYDIDDFRIGNDKAVIQEKINCPMLGTGKHVCGGWLGGRWLNTTFVFSKTQA